MNLDKHLKKLHMTVDTGLVYCNKLDAVACFSELFHIHEKAEKLGVTAVFFRREYNERNEVINSKPVVYVLEKPEQFFNSADHKAFQAKVWSAGDVDVYFVISKTKIEIFNARKQAKSTDDNELDLTELRLVADALDEFDDPRFSAMVFGKGLFWEQSDFSRSENETFYRNQLREENTPFHQLLAYLMAARAELKGKTSLHQDIIDKILIVCILIKFLEDSKDDQGTHTLKNIFHQFSIETFSEAVKKGILLDILERLANKFNGKIFDIFSPTEKTSIKNTNLSVVSDFLDAELDIAKKQYFLWKQYDFQYLPAELISSIYERFLPKEKGVVYTPPFLVNFLVDEVMPLNKAVAENYFSQEEFKVLDPACGSGVFLVAVYKRLLQWWSLNQFEKMGRYELPTKEICQNILEDNIFGVDIKETATFITVFSLTIALLEKLEPKEIWQNLKLKNLSDKNIKTNDFFEWALAYKNKSHYFDLVIGNPPFNPSSEKTNQDAVSDDLLKTFNVKNSDFPGQNNFALKFFEGSTYLGSKVCLILPVNTLLYNKSSKAYRYRLRLFRQLTIEKIFDYTHLRRELFSAETSACAILATSDESTHKAIQHIVIKRLLSIENRTQFEIDHYDCHTVPYNLATDPEKQFIWKCNLLGGGRLFHFIYRFSLLPTINNFIAEKKWISSRGFEGGNNKTKHSVNVIDSINNNEPIIKEKTISSNNFKDENIYNPPLIIIEQVIGRNSLSACFISGKYTGKLYYNRDYFAIVPSVKNEQKDEQEAKSLYKRLIENSKERLNYQAYALCLSSNCMIQHETAIRQEDISLLPFSEENDDYFRLSPQEILLQDELLTYYKHLRKSISPNRGGYCLEEVVSSQQLDSFGQVFCESLNPIYARNGKSWQAGCVYKALSFVVYQIGYGKDNGLNFSIKNIEADAQEIDSILNTLIYDDKSNRSAIFTRVCRLYKHINGYDCVYFIKPHATRYWLNSIALRDADDTFIDLKNGGF